MNKTTTLLALLGILFIGFPNAHAINYTLTANRTCSNISGTGTALAAGDNVTIQGNFTLTVDGTYSCTNITMGGGGANGTLSFNSGSQLTVNGAFSVGTNTRTGTINMTNGGKLIMGAASSFTIVNAANAILTPGSGTVNIVPAITLPAAFTTYNNLEANSAGTVNLGANTICNGYVNVISGTLHTVAASNFNLSVGTTFTIATGATFRSNNSVITCNGNFTLNGTYTTGTGNITFKGNFVNNGTYTVGTGTSIFGGTSTISGTVSPCPFNNVQVNSGSTLTLPAAITVASNWVNNGGTVVPGTGLVTFNSAAGQTIGGTAAAQTFNNITVNKAGGTLSFTGSTTTLNANNLTLTAGGFTACANINLTGNFAYTAGTFTHSSGKITFNGTGAQSLPGAAVIFNNIEVNKASGTLTQNANCTINGTLNMTAGTYNVGNFTITPGAASTLSATGGEIQFGVTGISPPNFTNFALTGGTLTLNRAGTQTLRPNVSYFSVVLGNTSAKTLTNVTSIQKNLTVLGTATMTSNSALTVGGTFTYNSSGTSTLTAANNISIGNFDQSAGTIVDNGVTITLTDSLWTRSGGTFTATGQVTMSGTTNKSITGSPTTFSKLFKQGSCIVTQNSDAVINAELNISGGTYIVGTNRLQGAANVNMNAGTLVLMKNDTVVPGLDGTYNLSGGLVEFQSTGNQHIRPVNYFNITLDNGTKVFQSGTTGIGALLTLSNGPTVDLRTNASTVSYNGTGAFLNQSIEALDYHHLDFGSASGTKTFGPGTTNISGNVTSSGATGDALSNGCEINFDGTTAQALTGTAIPSFYNLTNSNTAGLTTTGTISLFNTMTLGPNSVYTNAGTLKFKSDDIVTARLAEVPASAAFNGNISMEKYIPAINSAYGSYYFHIVGSPVNTGSFMGVVYDETNVGTIDLGFDCDTCLSPLSVGQGAFRNFGVSDTLISYPTAAPNIGNVVVPVTFTATSNSLDDGWNLISNPYPCEILWANVTLNNVASSAYLWNGTNYDEFLQVDGLSIPSGQGFWVKSTGNGSVTFHESDKVVDDNPLFMRTANVPDYPKLVLKMVGNGSFDLADIRFNPVASQGFDQQFDAYKLKGNSNAPRLSSLNNADQELAINSFPELNQNYDIPMVARCSQTGSYQMIVESMTGFPTSACLFLEDVLTGNFYDLRNTNSFDFSVVGSSVSTTRFILHVGAPVSVNVTDASCNNGDYTGSISAEGQGNGPWTYTWEDAAGNVLHTSGSMNDADYLTGVPAGSYTLIIQNTGGNCPITTEEITVGGYSPIAANAVLTSPTCFGDSNGSIQINADGGNGTLTSSWDASGSTSSQLTGLTAGSYSVTITDASGCSHHETISLTEPNEIIAACTASNNLVFLSNGGWVSFTNQSTGATSYRWNFGDGSAEYTGNTAAHQYAATGTYTVTLTAMNGVCENSITKEIQVESAPNGISNVSNQQPMQIVADKNGINLMFNLAPGKTVDIQIVNILGQIVYEKRNYLAGVSTLHAEVTAEGVYLVRVLDGANQTVKQICLGN